MLLYLSSFKLPVVALNKGLLMDKYDLNIETCSNKHVKWT